MNGQQFTALLQDPSRLPATSQEELAALVNRYPWFGAGHFLHAFKKRMREHPEAGKELQKAFLYAADPVWLNWQWHLFEQANGLRVPSIVEDDAATSAGQVDEEAAANAAVLLHVADTADQVDEEAASNAAALVAAVDTAELIDTSAAADASLLVEADEARQDLHMATAPAPPAAATDEPPAAQPAAPGEPIAFEPFHTVDYFASQGIRLKDDKLGNDALSNQVKTFTQWLRSMKKVYVEEKKELDINLEAAVMQIAVESNQQTEVITETMAEVLLQQGKIAKAIELFRKLSLLHPEKSSYFAARIDALKQ